MTSASRLFVVRDSSLRQPAFGMTGNVADFDLLIGDFPLSFLIFLCHSERSEESRIIKAAVRLHTGPACGK